MNRTLILACSATKLRDPPWPMPAFWRYDGPAWRTLRANPPGAGCSVFALSAEFGLIEAIEPIPDYDRELDGPRVIGLIDPVSQKIAELINQDRLRGEIFAYGGRFYRSLLEQAIQLAEMELERDIPVTYARGGIGEQLGQLKAFLTGAPTLAIAPELNEELERLAAAAAPIGQLARRCLVCAALNPCAEHSADDQHAELERNDRAIAKIREEAGR